MVPFIGVLTSLLVSIAVRIYLQYFCEHASRHPGFERFCGERPLVLALFCPRSGSEAALPRLSALLGRRGEYVNAEGGFPWPFYRVRLVAHRLSESVVGVTIEGCGLLRGQQRRPPVMRLLRELCDAGFAIEELWLHGAMHAGETGEPAGPEHTWRANPGRDGQLRLRAFPELPFWLRRFEGGGPPDRREQQPRARSPEPSWGLSLPASS